MEAMGAQEVSAVPVPTGTVSSPMAIEAALAARVGAEGMVGLLLDY
jgi:hypothetical protein